MGALHLVHGFLEILLPNRENVVDIVVRLCAAVFFFFSFCFDITRTNTAARKYAQHNNHRPAHRIKVNPTSSMTIAFKPAIARSW